MHALPSYYIIHYKIGVDTIGSSDVQLRVATIMFSFIVASGSTTRRSSSIFRQLSTSSFFAPIFKRQQSIIIDKNNNAIFHESRNRAKGIPNLATRLFSSTSTCGDDDNDDEDNHFRFPPLRGNILVVGDGDFSYSVALAKENQAQGDAKITASSLDTKDFIEETYSKGKENLEILNLDSNVQLKHELDVTENGSCGNERVWDSIVWNFPYPPNTYRANHQEGSALLAGFFRNLRPILKPDGAIFVTLWNKQGENNAWDLEGTAWDSNLAVTRVLSFCASYITGYVPKRAYIDKKIPINDCNTYVIRLQNDLQLKLKGKYSSELENLAPIRRDIYNLCFTRGQAYQLFEKETDIISSQFFEFYENKFGGRQINEMKHLFSIINSDLMNSLNLVSYEGHFTVKEIHKVLEEEGEFKLSQFKQMYKIKFGKSPIYTPGKLVDSFKFLSKVGAFHLVERPEGSGRYAVLVSRDCTAEEVQNMLYEEAAGKLDAGAFRRKYERKFGRPPFPEGVKVREALEELSHSGKFLVDNHGAWIIKAGKSRVRKSNENVDCTANNICELVEEKGGELYVGQFRLRFEEEFGRPPFSNKVKLKDALEELSHSGTFQLKTRGSGLWITLPPGTK